MKGYIEIKGLSENNLKIPELRIPIGKMVCLTGPSGSGKSTLGRQVLFQEARRLYLESLGLERDVLSGVVQRPKADLIKGLPPAIYLEQVPERFTSRSQVASYTDCNILLRTLYALIGLPHCPLCKIPIRVTPVSTVARHLAGLPQGTRFAIMFPLPKRHEDNKSLFKRLETLRGEGFVRIEKKGRFYLLEELGPGEISILRGANVVIDRIVTRDGILKRVEDSLRIAESRGPGVIRVLLLPGDEDQERAKYLEFSLNMTCPKCLRSYPDLTPQTLSRYHPMGQCPKCLGKGCKKCSGTGLSLFSNQVLIDGLSFPEIMEKSISELKETLEGLLDHIKKEDPRIRPLLEALFSRISTIERAGLSYLGLSRPLTTLSRGELQRLRIGIHIDKGLSGILFILDEPTVGLSPKDLEGLIRLLLGLRDKGNTVLVIEHEERIIKKADWIIELGPGGGSRGGKVTFVGPSSSYIKGGPIETRWKKAPRRPIGYLRHSHLSSNNLKDLSLNLPLGVFVVVTGASGSGKSTLILKEIPPLLRKKGYRVHSLDQSPVKGGKNSMVATYLGVFPYIRRLFARTREARERGFEEGVFSLSKDGGRCKECKGAGIVTMNLYYLPPVEMPCPICLGKRYKPDILRCHYKEKDISKVLELTVVEAESFFSRIKSIRIPLSAAIRAGLDYLRLGQSTASLSGGERMRLRLSRLLAKEATWKEDGGHQVLILDEPSAGLHPREVEALVKTLDVLVDQGISVLVADHDSRILRESDWVIELGPGGGPESGRLINEGPP